MLSLIDKKKNWYRYQYGFGGIRQLYGGRVILGLELGG
jgi:hypothetical protein